MFWFFSISISNGAPLDTSTAGGVSERRAKVLKRPLRPSERPEELLLDHLDAISLIKLTNFDGYSFINHGRETTRQVLMMVTSDSIIVQIVAGMR